ncbi:MAG: PfkB family carbohydrate kinase [Acidobacteriota bacterium]|nr:PfkB family carbohydrate kinase [Acidobacteriota bacterium]
MQRSDSDLQSRLLSLAEQFNGRRIIVVGDIIADEYMYGQLSRLSREAPVPILSYDGTTVVPGGAANAASNVATLGGQADLIGLAGRGGVDRKVIQALPPEVDTARLLRPAGYHVPVKTRILAGGQHSARQQIVRVDRDSSPVDSTVFKKKIARAASAALSNADAVIISDYGSGLITPELVETLKTQLTKRRRRRQVPVVADSRYNLIRFRGCTACTPNQAEVEASLGISIDDNAPNLETAGRTLLKRTRARGVVITLGSRGMAVFAPGRRTDHIAIYGSDEVADVTGAGDTVIATLTLALSAGASLYEAACLANYAGGLVVLKRGTATVSGDELVAAIHGDRDREG